MVAFGPAASAGEVVGAGAALPEEVLLDWSRAAGRAAGVTLRYQSTDVAEGLRRVRAGQADFSASEAPLGIQELAARGLAQFPIVIGGVVPVVNVPGVVPGAVRLTGPVLADIFRGRIRNWDAPALTALNPDLGLPHDAIRIAHPAAASGAVLVFTAYLSAVSPQWRSDVGSGLTVHWPAGEERAASEVPAFVRGTPGAIALVDFGHASDEGLARAQLQNRAGQFVSANVMSFQAAAASAPWESTPGYALMLVDGPGKGSWPLTTCAFALLPVVPRDPARAASVLKFFQWSLRDGAALARSAGFVPLPASLGTLVEGAWKRQFKRADGNPVWDGKAPLK